MTAGFQSSPSPRTSRRAVAVAAITVLVLAVLAPAGAPAAPSPRPFLEEVGALERFGDDARTALGGDLVPQWSQVESDITKSPQKNNSGTAIAIPEMRQLWQLYPHLSAARTGIVVRDLDTLRITKTLVLSDRFERATSTQGGDWTHAVDPGGGRLFLLGCSCPGDRPTHVYEIDLRSFAVKKRPVLASADPTNLNFVAAVLPGGMTYDPFADDLLLLYGGPANSGVVNSATFLYRLDLSGPQVDFDPIKLYRLRSCTGPVGSTDVNDDTLDWDILVTREFLYVPCMRAGHTVIVVRTPRPEGTKPDHPEEFVAGPVTGEAVLADQQSGRLFVVPFTGQEIWAFEAASMAFTGVAATGPANTGHPTGFGLDRTTGRVFFQSPTFGLGVVEGRFFPLPQARTHPRRVQGQERILSDAAKGKLFVLEGYSTPPTKPAAYRIYRLAPAPVPPPPPDPDHNTADVPEREGVTEARWNATGSGYGSRVLLAKGYATVAPAPSLGSVAPTAGPTISAFKDRCGFTDRDLFAGRVARAEYDTGSTSAQATAAEVDGTTRQDLNQPSRCQLAFLGDNPERWAYTPAVCSSGAGDTRHEPAGGKGALGSLGTAAVACPASGGVLSAGAETTLTRAAAVEADRSETAVTVERIPGAGGVRSTVESVVEGVSIDLPGLGLLNIGEIRSKATSTSNGRPRRRDMSTHDIEVSHVRLGTTPVCEVKCDPVELERDLNALAGSRAVIRTGHGSNSGRDDALVEGSPRGAQTAVQKSTARQSSDRALVGDYTTEVPAFEVTVFNDNAEWGRARQIYQFAGVASSATYNVVPRPTETGFDDDGKIPPGDLPPADTGGNLFAGSVEDLLPAASDVVTVAPASRERPPGDDDGGLAGAVSALARGLRLLLTSPRMALLLSTAWALLASPAVLSRRRRLLAGVRLS